MSSFPKINVKFPDKHEVRRKWKMPASRPKRRIDRHKKEYIKELWERRKGRAKINKSTENPRET